MLEGRDALPAVLELIRETDFYAEAHRTVFAASAALFGRSEGVDVITVCEELRRTGRLDASGGAAGLALMVESASIAANLSSYCGIVRDLASMRELIQASTQSIGDAFAARRPAAEVVDDAERRIFALADRRLSGRSRRLGPVLRESFERIEAARLSGHGVTGLPTGIERLDSETSGLQPSDLVIVAGRPSMGKTAFALNLVQRAALDRGARALVLSLEMSAPQLATRMLCSEAKVDAQALRTGRLAESDWRKLTAAAGRLSDAAILLDDAPDLGALEARAKARRAKAELGGLDLVVVDYLQLMRGAGGENRQQEISQISRALKALAKELDVPVVALSQLSRAPESRQVRDHRPQLSDLRESGAIEQDADLVLFLYRAAAYKEDLPPEERAVAEIIIGKQRNGPVGTVRTVFVPEYGRFENMAPPRQDPPF